MANTTGTVSGDLATKCSLEREIWLRVPFYVRLAFTVVSSALSLCLLATSIFVAWELAVWLFNSSVIQGFATGTAIAFWLQWIFPICVGLGTAFYCLLNAERLLDWLQGRSRSSLVRHFS